MRKLLTSKLTRARLDPFLARQANTKYTLDIGCANAPYANLFPNRVGFDEREAPGVDVVGDAHALPFPDDTFEQILWTEVLEHLHAPQQAIDEMRRVLAPGGTLILTTRFIFPLHDVPGDFFRYTKYGLRHLLREWEIVSLEEEAGTMETLGVLLQRIAFQADLRGGIITKTLFLMLARITGVFSFLIKKEYGMRSKIDVREEQSILASGYYVIARKS
jgi:SAM-dependent methyltransferase